MTKGEVFIPEGWERLAPGVAPGVQGGKGRSTPEGVAAGQRVGLGRELKPQRTRRGDCTPEGPPSSFAPLRLERSGREPSPEFPVPPSVSLVSFHHPDRPLRVGSVGSAVGQTSGSVGSGRPPRTPPGRCRSVAIPPSTSPPPRLPTELESDQSSPDATQPCWPVARAPARNG
jgi:hypothetical protein